MSSNNGKRKREQDGELVDEVARPGSQVLPVATHLPESFSGEPQDGAEYLFMVRRDAFALPIVTRAQNPHAIGQVNTPLLPSSSVPQIRPRHPELPSREWMRSFENKFAAFRKNIHTAKLSKESQETIRSLKIPHAKDRDGWWSFINGKSRAVCPPTPTSSHEKCQQSMPEHESMSVASPSAIQPSEDDVTRPGNHESSDEEGEEIKIQMTGILEEESAEDQVTPSPVQTVAPRIEPMTASHLPQNPTLAVIQSLDQKTTRHVVMFFSHWITTRLDSPPTHHTGIPALNELHSRWLFALLAHLDDRLASEEIGTLRVLARACVTLVRRALEFRPKLVDGQTDGTAGCWMVFAAVTSVWVQKDLWQDAEDILYGPLE